jgi:hypothetical protein
MVIMYGGIIWQTVNFLCKMFLYPVHVLMNGTNVLVCSTQSHVFIKTRIVFDTSSTPDRLI